ncbi:hypothetical protein EJ02DRAFT_29059 [Clathrospora elynae]|uniref:BZIP domain-containing protein n=1 Tax=Clathrospora elynae TaxID=706981 RepID=A0A6A5SC97_9PLEO|nr:hypothetical protein EJ02DRAFT_29059 [Clathrospora elynae]
MTRNTVNTKATNLERVRNNQRRCRARRKEYIKELEARTRQFQCTSAQASTDLQLGELRVELELLKRLLRSLGLNDGFLESYSKAAKLVPTTSHARVDLNSLVQANDASSSSQFLDNVQSGLTPLLNLHQDSWQSLESLNPVDATQPWEPFDFSNGSNTFSEATAIGSSISPIADDLVMETSSKSMVTGGRSPTTTLCSAAFSLVLENNRKGYNAHDLDLKLRGGYRFSATPLEGCRVDNNTLLGVLAEIS